MTKYVKNVGNGSLEWVFMVLKHRLNVFKALIFLTCKNNIIYSQMRFHLCQSLSLTVLGLKRGNKSINWVSMGILETLRWP